MKPFCISGLFDLTRNVAPPYPKTRKKHFSWYTIFRHFNISDCCHHFSFCPSVQMELARKSYFFRHDCRRNPPNFTNIFMETENEEISLKHKKLLSFSGCGNTAFNISYVSHLVFLVIFGFVPRSRISFRCLLMNPRKYSALLWISIFNIRNSQKPPIFNELIGISLNMEIRKRFEENLELDRPLPTTRKRETHLI